MSDIGPASPRSLLSRAARVAAALETAFSPLHLAVIDDSASHAGHAGASAAGETHFRVTMVASAFHGMSRVARSRAVHTALAAEFAAGLHALALTLRTPEEMTVRGVSPG